MHLLLITYVFHPEPVLVTELAAALVLRGHRVTVLTGAPNYPTGRLYPGYRGDRTCIEWHQGVRVVRVPMVPRGSSRAQLGVNYLSCAISKALLGPFLCSDSYDAVLVNAASPFTTAFPGWVLSRCKRAPLLVWLQDPWPESVEAASGMRNRFMLGAIERFVGFIYRRCQLILIQSRGYRRHLDRFDVPEHRVRYFPNAGTYLDESPEAPEGDLGLEGFSLVYAGNIGPAQDLETVLEAAAELPQVRFYFVGTGSRRGWLEQEVVRRRLQDRIIVRDPLPKASLTIALRKACCLLVTLKNHPILHQTIPSKLQYYLELGRPIAGVLEGEAARILRESGAGLVSAPGDAHDLARNIRWLASHCDDLATLGRSGQDYYASHFHKDRLLSQLVAWVSR